MTTTTLGPNGPTVTALGIGTWSWGDKLFWGYGDDYGADQVKAAFEAAVAAGITFFGCVANNDFSDNSPVKI